MEEKSIFTNAKYGDKFICRNGTIAYYCRKYEKGTKCNGDEEDRHCLMVSDEENDFVMAYDDGHIFHIDYEWRNPRTGKSICESYGWKEEDMKLFRLDIVSRCNEQ